MSMFTVKGQVLNVFTQPGVVDKETGEIGESTDRVQLLGELPQANGEIKLDMITLKVTEKKLYQTVKGKNVRIPLGFFATGKNSIVYYIPKGSRPELISESQAA